MDKGRRRTRLLRRSRAAVARRGLALALLLASPDCARVQGLEYEIVYRFADPRWRTESRWEPATLLTSGASAFPSQRGAARIPTATLADDTRYVLASHPRSLLAYQMSVKPRAPGHLSVAIPLGDAFPGARGLALLPAVRRPTQPARSLAPTHAPVQAGEGGRQVVLDLLHPGLRLGEELLLTVIAHRSVDEMRTLHITPERLVPPGARLEFAAGLLEPQDGPVRFRVEACQGEHCQGLFDEVLAPSAAEVLPWQDRSVSLEAVAGSRRSFRFAADRMDAAGAFLPVWANPTLLVPARGGERPPNIVLVSLDTLRRDHLEVYGYGRSTTPYLRKELAARGIVFENLVAEAATTDPSHMTLFTSLPSLVHGVVSGGMNRLPVPVVTLAERLREHGYETAAFTENGPLAHERGFSIGFSEYTENKSANLVRPRGYVERTFDQAREWVERKTDRPFFLFLHTFQVHAPYEPPAEYSDHFAGPPNSPTVDAPVRELVDAYDREIRYVDDALADLHGWFGEQALAGRTWWVILSDHGEAFLEHGSQGHATLPYEEVLGVPLVVMGPGVPPGRRSAAPLHHADLMPTLLELAGAPLPDAITGRSFAGLLRGDAPSETGAHPRFSTSWALPPGLEPPALAVRFGDRKLIRYRGPSGVEEVLFDLEADPGEQNDLLGSAADAGELRELLRGFEVATRAERARRLAGVPAAAGAEGPPILGPEREQMLRSLGYLD